MIRAFLARLGLVDPPPEPWQQQPGMTGWYEGNASEHGYIWVLTPAGSDWYLFAPGWNAGGDAPIKRFNLGQSVRRWDDDPQRLRELVEDAADGRIVEYVEGPAAAAISPVESYAVYARVYPRTNPPDVEAADAAAAGRLLVDVDQDAAAPPVIAPALAWPIVTRGYADFGGGIRAEVLCNHPDALFALTADWRAVQARLPEILDVFGLDPIPPERLGPDSVRWVRVVADPINPADVERWRVTCNAPTGDGYRLLTAADAGTVRAVYVDLDRLSLAEMGTAVGVLALAATDRYFRGDPCLRDQFRALAEAAAVDDGPRIRRVLDHLRAEHPAAWGELGRALADREGGQR